MFRNVKKPVSTYQFKRLTFKVFPEISQKFFYLLYHRVFHDQVCNSNVNDNLGIKY